jgi:hypothetical protein
LVFEMFAHVWRSWRADRRMRQLLRETPATAIEDLAENTLGKLAGRAEPIEGRALVAPLSGRYCVYFAIAIQERQSSGAMTLLAHDHHAVPFQLVHGNQYATVDPTDAKFSVALDYISESRAVFDASPEQRKLLERYQLHKRNWFQTKSLVYREGVIELGEAIAVYGAGVREPDVANAPGPGYRESGVMRLKLTGTARFPLNISDDPRTLDR